jgi:hypothetical protein
MSKKRQRQNCNGNGKDQEVEKFEPDPRFNNNFIIDCSELMNGNVTN